MHGIHFLQDMKHMNDTKPSPFLPLKNHQHQKQKTPEFLASANFSIFKILIFGVFFITKCYSDFFVDYILKIILMPISKLNQSEIRWNILTSDRIWYTVFIWLRSYIVMMYIIFIWGIFSQKVETDAWILFKCFACKFNMSSKFMFVYT